MIPMIVPAVVAFIIACIHTFAGGRELVPPLLSTRDMKTPVMLTHYYCWHIVTLVLFALSAAFLWAALDPGARELAVFATIISTLSGLWGIALVTWKKQRLIDMPQWPLFAALTGAGVLALV